MHRERGEIDEIKLAIAGMMGAMFLSNLRHKTLRGMEAAVLAGRIAGGKAYGYRRQDVRDARGEIIRGLFEIDPTQESVVRRIHREFAEGRSAIDIARRLTAERVPGPRGGEWNSSTIRGDPKRLLGILNNPLYRGRIVWGRQEWRKDPDSERRERRYRMRAREEWTEIEAPDLRIVDADTAAAVDAELVRRARPIKENPVRSRRGRHLLSGLIKCGSCGANYTIQGKDYYRCACNKDGRGCTNSRTVRVKALEESVLAGLQKDLLTHDLAAIFATEFRREVERLTRTRNEAEVANRSRLAVIDGEIEVLSRNLLAGVVGPTIMNMLAEREQEKSELEAMFAPNRPIVEATVIPHPVLLRRYEERVGNLRASLTDPAAKVEAANALRSLIETVTIQIEGDAIVAELEASTSKLIDFASNAESPRRRGVGGCSVTVVAGTGTKQALSLQQVHETYRFLNQGISKIPPSIPQLASIATKWGYFGIN